MPGITVRIGDGVSAFGETDDAGAFALMVPVEPRKPRLAAEKRRGAGDAVSALDAVYILQHLVGARSLSEDQVLACDTTGDGVVTALDAARVLDLAVGDIERLPVMRACDSDWLFRVATGAREDRVLSCDNPSVEIDGAAPALEVVALLPGDCTGNWTSPASASKRLVAPRRSRARVRVGRLRLRGKRALLPVYIRSPSPYNSIDMDVAYDFTALRPQGVHLRGQRGDPIVQMSSKGADGFVRLAIASAEPLNRGRRQLVVLEFEVLTDGLASSPTLVTLKIDEQSPRLSQFKD